MGPKSADERDPCSAWGTLMEPVGWGQADRFAAGTRDVGRRWTSGSTGANGWSTSKNAESERRTAGQMVLLALFLLAIAFLVGGALMGDQTAISGAVKV